MAQTKIIGIGLKNRLQDANKLQSIFTKYGYLIRTRLGLHHFKEQHSADEGVLILELEGDAGECLAFENELLEIEGLEVQKMVFKY
jgi:hypothetical protein